MTEDLLNFNKLFQKKGIVPEKQGEISIRETLSNPYYNGDYDKEVGKLREIDQKSKDLE